MYMSLILVSLGIVLSIMIRNDKFRMYFICGVLIIFGIFQLISGDNLLNLIVPASMLNDVASSNYIKTIWRVANVILIMGCVVTPVIETLHNSKNKQ